MRQAIREYIRASQTLLELNDLSDEERNAVTATLERLTMLFPDEGDAATD